MTLIETFEPVGEHDRRLALGAKGVMAQFNAAGVITAADVHIATTLARAVREKDADAVLAAALASRAVRSGSVALDATGSAIAGREALPDLPWPDPESWVEAIAGSRLVSQGALVVEHGLVYLQRYHHQEVQVIEDLQARAALTAPEVDEAVLAAGLERIFPGPGYAEQRVAAEVVARARTSVITGGPGTGKTTTVAGVLALLAEQAAALDRGEASGASAGTLAESTRDSTTGATRDTTSEAMRGTTGTTRDTTTEATRGTTGATRDTTTEATRGTTGATRDTTTGTSSDTPRAASEGRLLRVGLAAPTGKAAARVKAAVARALDEILERTPDPATRALIAPLGEVEPMTLHRLLGWRPGSRTRFRHDRSNRLPHDVVLVDEASMVSLTHMARLLEALRPAARLILVGDADQLVSVDAGAVLADLVAGAEQAASTAQDVGTAQEVDTAREVGTAREAGAELAATTGQDPETKQAATTGQDPETGPAKAVPTTAYSPIALARLRTVHRFGETIGTLAEALRVGDGDAVVAALSASSTEVEWVTDADPTAYLRPLLTRHARSVLVAARSGAAEEALAALGEHRLLCAHREGPQGVRTWNQLTESWLTEETGLTFYDPMYVGRPLIVTANDYATGVLNGDTGVVIQSRKPDGTPVRMVVVEGATGAHRFTPSRLGDVDTMHAMTIHKAQGSQAREITVLLPEVDSPLLTRELFYTAVTRAQERVRVIGSEDVVRAAVERRVVRASGLRQRLAAGSGV